MPLIWFTIRILLCFIISTGILFISLHTCMEWKEEWWSLNIDFILYKLFLNCYGSFLVIFTLIFAININDFSITFYIGIQIYLLMYLLLYVTIKFIFIVFIVYVILTYFKNEFLNWILCDDLIIKGFYRFKCGLDSSRVCCSDFILLL